MKVKFKYGIETYSGKIDGMVFNSCRKGHLCIGREFVYPTLTTNNTNKGAITKNLAVVYHNASSGYQADLKSYGVRNGQENVSYDQMVPSGYNLFMKMMYAWAKTDPLHIDLTAVTVADIVTMDAEVMTLERAIDAGYLAKVSSYNDLTAEIQ